MMSITELALKNSRITVAAIVLIALAGASTYLIYPSAEDPTITIREATVTASYPGMSADRVEDLITKPIENAMREIAEIDDIKSTSKTGETQVDLTIHDSIDDLDAVFQDIRNKAADIESQLPEGTNGPSVNDDVGLTAIATIALWSDGFSMAEMRDVSRDVRDRLYTLEGIKRVQILGTQDERIYLEINPSKVAQLGVSPQAVVGALVGQNVISPGGKINAGGRSVLLEPSGNYESVDEIRETVFTIPNTNRVARLDEVFDIVRTRVDPPQMPSFFNDHEAIILSVSTVEGTNNVEFGQQMTSMLDGIQQELPIGYVLEYATFQPDLIEASVQGAVSNVYQTLAIVLAVVMVFLGLRTGLIVGSFVPMTMLLGIIVMSLLGVELQRMSIAAMIIALGLLVDNGIVVAEDIRVRLERGVERTKAAIDSGRTLAVPLLTSSLTTIFAFLPMLLVEGGAGDYVRSLAQVVAILLLASWFLSMTMTPVMCAWFMTIDTKAPDTQDTETTSYKTAAQATAPTWGYQKMPWQFLARSRHSINQPIAAVSYPAASAPPADRPSTPTTRAWPT
jgi:multidrug efflux pump